MDVDGICACWIPETIDIIDFSPKSYKNMCAKNADTHLGVCIFCSQKGLEEAGPPIGRAKKYPVDTASTGHSQSHLAIAGKSR